MPDIEYVHVAYDFMDNGAGDLMMVMDVPEGDMADDDNAKFVWDGFAEGMLLRNSEQIVHLPIIPNGIHALLKKVDTILITEMDGDDIDDTYMAQVEITNAPPAHSPIGTRQQVCRQYQKALIANGW